MIKVYVHNFENVIGVGNSDKIYYRVSLFAVADLISFYPEDWTEIGEL